MKIKLFEEFNDRWYERIDEVTYDTLKWNQGSALNMWGEDSSSYRYIIL